MSFGMWRRLDILRTDVSEEHVASIFSVEKYTKRLTLLFLACFFYPEDGSDMFLRSVLTRSTRRCIPKDGILHSNRRENLNSHTRILEVHISNLGRHIATMSF
jgi:hypothetical protein